MSWHTFFVLACWAHGAGWVFALLLYLDFPILELAGVILGVIGQLLQRDD